MSQNWFNTQVAVMKKTEQWRRWSLVALALIVFGSLVVLAPQAFTTAISMLFFSNPVWRLGVMNAELGLMIATIEIAVSLIALGIVCSKYDQPRFGWWYALAIWLVTVGDFFFPYGVQILYTSPDAGRQLFNLLWGSGTILVPIWIWVGALAVLKYVSDRLQDDLKGSPWKWKHTLVESVLSWTPVVLVPLGLIVFFVMLYVGQTIGRATARFTV